MTFKDMLEDERDEGRAEGRVEGAKAKACEMAKALVAQGKLSVSEIAVVSGLSEDKIRKL